MLGFGAIYTRGFTIVKTSHIGYIEHLHFQYSLFLTVMYFCLLLSLNTAQIIRYHPRKLFEIWHLSCQHAQLLILCDQFVQHTPLASHDDVIKWKHFPRYWPFVRGIHRSPHKGQWRGALMFSLICVWINDWVNNSEAGDLRRNLAHCDVIVIKWLLSL